MQRKKASSLDNFQAFYSEQFGKDWPSILESLSQTTQHCAVVNKFSSQEEVHEKLSSTEAEFLNVSIFNSHEDIQNELQLKCYFPNSSNRVRFPKQDKTSNGYFDYYLLDASSMLPVLALDIPYLFGYKPISAISRDPKLLTQKINLINTNCKCIILGYKPRAILGLEVYRRP